MYLRRNPICEGRGDVRRGALLWEFNARPLPSSREYGLQLTLSVEADLAIIIERPDVVALAQGRKLPHVYGESPVELCLFHPKYGEWRPHMRLDDTVVPWAYLWLMYFEDWLASGEWRGGGMHPEPDSANRLSRRRSERSRTIWQSRR